jgi:hypothetical protein
MSVQRWVFSFTARPRYPRGNRLRHPLDRRLGWSQSWSERRGEETGLQSNPDTALVQSVYRLRYPGSLLLHVPALKNVSDWGELFMLLFEADKLEVNWKRGLLEHCCEFLNHSPADMSLPTRCINISSHRAMTMNFGEKEIWVDVFWLLCTTLVRPNIARH